MDDGRWTTGIFIADFLFPIFDLGVEFFWLKLRGMYNMGGCGGR